MSAAVFSIQRVIWIDRVVDAYFGALQVAEANRHREYHAAIRIQAWTRGSLYRKHLARLYRAATKIQTLFRGYVGRCHVEKLMQNAHFDTQRRIWNELATTIQKVYRGYRSRATLADFYKRKRFLLAVKDHSDHILQQLKDELERKKQEERARREVQAAEEFQRVTENLHHMLSTKATAGIFKSPYGPQHSSTAFDIPVEEHIVDSFENRQRRLALERKEFRKQDRIRQQKLRELSEKAQFARQDAKSNVASLPHSALNNYLDRNEDVN